MNHLYESPDGVLHYCEGGNVAPDIYVVWTKCEIDVPVNQSFKSHEQPNCQKCLALNE